MKMVTAFVRTSTVEHILKKLENIGIRSLTISEIRGTGEEVPLFRHYTIHDKIEIIVPDDRAEEVATIIAEHAARGLAGDGIVAVSPVDYAIKIRTKEKLT